MSSLMRVICVWDGLRQEELSCAARIAVSGNIPLVVAVPATNPKIRDYLSRMGIDKDDYVERIENDVRQMLSGLKDVAIRPESLLFDGTLAGLQTVTSAQDLFVSDRFAQDIRWARVIRVNGEEELFRKERLNVLVALGNESDAERTAGHALRDIEMLLPVGGTVVLYHTTWRDTLVNSDISLDHVCREAVDVLAAAKRLLDSKGLSSSVVVGMAETVVGGIAAAALRNRASLMVVARDPCVLHGDYALQLLELTRGSVPVLILPARGVFDEL